MLFCNPGKNGLPFFLTLTDAQPARIKARKPVASWFGGKAVNHVRRGEVAGFQNCFLKSEHIIFFQPCRARSKRFMFKTARSFSQVLHARAHWKV